tara:strand:- start:3208 stop:4674 length:1467 start_codon:yes stop_codon:yes gene_type:complete
MAIQGVAQITIDSSDFASAGDTFTIVVGKNPSVVDVKGGANSTWDFSNLSVDSLSGAKARAINKSVYPIDSLFPNSSFKLTSSSYGESYLIKGKDSLILDGIANQQLVQGSPGLTFNFNPNVKLLEFPMDYNDVFSSQTFIDTIVDTVITALSFDKIRVKVHFAFNSKVEGHGKLITSQDTTDVLKLYTEEAQNIEVFGRHTIAGWISTPFISQRDTIHAYRWFGKGEGYQVAEATADEKDGNTIEASFLLSDGLFSFIADSSNPSCFGLSDGSAKVQATGGTGTYSYKWSNGMSTSTVNNLSSGNYTVTITDLISSKTTATNLNLEDPAKISFILISKKDEGPLPGTGEIEIGVLGGTPPYSYAWDKSTSTDKIASDLVGGDHKITVTDDNGCKKDTTIGIGSTVGIEKVVHSSFKVFPNPFSEILTIEGLENNAKITVLDLTGKTIYEKHSKSEYEELDLNSLKSGIYLFQVVEGQNITSLRLVKN